MPHVQLPLFPSGTTRLNEVLAYERREDQVVDYNGHLPVFTHRTDDLGSFRLFTTQLSRRARARSTWTGMCGCNTAT